MNKLMSILAAGLLLPSMAFAEVVVIVHPSNGDAISQDEISRIFLGKKSSFPSGGSATPLYLADGDAARDEFSEKALSKNASQLKAYWSKLVFTGKGKPPEEVSGGAAMVAKVSSDTSAIGYVDASAVTDAVKVVARFP